MALTPKKQILFTLAYTLQFEYPLTIYQLYERLVSSEPIAFTDFIFLLKDMISSEEVTYSSGYIFLGNLSQEKITKLIQTREKRKKYSQKKWAESDIFINLAQRIPFIVGVAVTGSVAMDNAVQDDDVDFLIVTQENRLWITRLLVVGMASFLGKRRSFAKEEKNSWCFNLWIETSDIQLPTNKRSIYEAYEVMQTQWVYSKNQIAEKFFISNSWVRKYLPHSPIYCLVNRPQRKLAWSAVSFFSIIMCFFDLFLDVCNSLCYTFQFWYMKRHMTREKVSASHAFFHPRDTKTQVLTNVEKLLKL